MDEVRHTRVVLEGEAATVTLRATRARSCSCRPEVQTSAGPAVRLVVCDCCDLCDCIDPGYEGTVRLSGLPVGERAIEVGPGETVSVSVVREPVCFDGATVTDVSVEGPGPRYTAGPEAWWVRVAGTVETCCTMRDPDIAFRDAPGIPGALHVEALHCDRCPIDCLLPETVPFVAWHPLLDPPPGERRVVVGGVEVGF